MELSHRVNAIKESPTLAITAKAQKLKAEGRDVVALAAGEPDFDTPDHIKAAAIEAINKGFTKYTPVSGTPALKKAIVEKFKRDNGLEYAANQVLVSVGGKQSFYNLCQAYINDGDEVIIPAPYWVSYPDMTILAGGVPVVVECGIEQGYKLTFFEDGGKCATAFPVMAKVKAWRIYTDGRMAFADETGKDLIIFKAGKGFKRYAAKKVDGIAYLLSAQEVAE